MSTQRVSFTEFQQRLNDRLDSAAKNFKSVKKLSSSSRVALAQQLWLVANQCRQAWMPDFFLDWRFITSAIFSPFPISDELRAIQVCGSFLFFNFHLLQKQHNENKMNVNFVNISPTLQHPEYCSNFDKLTTFGYIRESVAQILVETQESFFVVFSEETKEHHLAKVESGQLFAPALFGFFLEYPVLYVNSNSGSSERGNCLAMEALVVTEFLFEFALSECKTSFSFSVPKVLQNVQRESELLTLLQERAVQFPDLKITTRTTNQTLTSVFF